MIYGINIEHIAITGKGIIDEEGHGIWNIWKPKENRRKVIKPRNESQSGIGKIMMYWILSTLVMF